MNFYENPSSWKIFPLTREFSLGLTCHWTLFLSVEAIHIAVLYIIALFFAGEVKTLLLQLLKAVAHMHDNWILHRDLKTSNLLLSHKGILKVGLIPYIERKYSRYWIRHDYIWIIFLCAGNSQWCVYILCTCTLRNTKSNKIWLAVQHSVRCTASRLVDIGNKDRATLIINRPHSATWLGTARFITSFWVFRFNKCHDFTNYQYLWGFYLNKQN